MQSNDNRSKPERVKSIAGKKFGGNAHRVLQD